MNGSEPYKNRRLIPRWRTASQITSSGELQFPQKSKILKSFKHPILKESNALLGKLVAKWKIEKSIESAAELVSTGLVVGVNSEVEYAAKFLVDSSEIVAPAVVEASKNLLGGNVDHSAPFKSNFDDFQDVTSIYRRISNLKIRVQTAPRDAISRIELARLYTILGQKEPARNCIHVAIALAPENRFVLRTASRFFVHIGDIDKGLNVIRMSNSIASDPWLQATEISLSDIGNTSSKYLKIALKHIEMNTWQPRHCAELSGAAATMLSKDGGFSKVRKLMKLSVRDPNENALTQAEWAYIQGWAPRVSQDIFHGCFDPEARALRDRQEMNWEQAIAACIEWSNMDPTSSRPLDYGAFISIVALENGKKALKFLKRAELQIPSNPTVFNNLAVAHAYNGDIEQATIQLSKLSSLRLSEDKKPVYFATKGLIAYRNGDIETGRNFYFKSIRKFNELKNRSLKILAIWHLLREESKLGTPELENLVENFTYSVRHSNSFPEIKALREQIKVELKKSQRKKFSHNLTPLQNAKGIEEICS